MSLPNDPDPTCYQIGETVPLGKWCCLGANAILQENGTYVCRKDIASSYSGMRASGTARIEGTTVAGGGGEKKSDNTVLILIGAIALGLILLGGKK